LEHSTVTPTQAIFVNLVSDGMRRAYRAAELVERKHKTYVEVMLADRQGQLDAADPDDLPEVRFMWHGEIHGRYEAFEDTLSIGATFGQMAGAVEVIVRHMKAESKHTQGGIATPLPEISLT
jgi:hypothetical protein